MEASERFEAVMADGARIVCRIFGGGERALLLLHGNGEDHTCFQKQVAAFSGRFRVIAMDSRGHGEASAGSGVTIAKIAEDAAAVLGALGIERASVVGFSDGANAALGLALSHPGMVEKLALAGANLFPAGVKPRFQLPAELEYRALRLCGRFSERLRRRAEIVGLMVEEPRYTPGMLGAITVPTLVLAGDRDLIRPAHTALIAASLPHAKLVTIPRSDHWIFARQPVRVNREILAFLG